jgi:hypothetical protein
MSDELNQTATDPAPAPTDAAPAAPPTPAELDELRAKAAKADEHWDRLLRPATVIVAKQPAAEAATT